MAVAPKLITWYLFLLCAVCANGQKFFFEQLTTAEGLPSDYINQVYEDSKGFLWIATDKGACRYDGREFLLFNKDNGLPDNFVICITEDKKGQIWMGTYEGGICKFDGQKIISSPLKHSHFKDAISQIHFNADNSFLVVTREPETYFFPNESSEPKILFHQLSFITPITEEKFLTAGRNESFILRRTKNNFSLEKSRKWIQEDLIRPRQNHKNFLVNRKDELCLYEPINDLLEFKRRIPVKLSMSYGEVKDYDIEDGRILIGTTHGLIYIDEDGKEFLLGSGNGLGSDYVNSIGKDKKGNIYICTFGAGIKIWKGLYSEKLDISGKTTSIFPFGKKVYITTTQNSYEYALSTHQLSAFYKLDRGNFTVIYRAPEGTVYLGSLINYYRMPDELAWQRLSDRNKSRYLQPANQGTSGFLFKNNRTYVSTYGDGIILLDKQGSVTDTLKFESGIVESLAPLSNGVAALSFSSGLTLIDSLDQIQKISKDQGLLSNTVHAVFEEKENDLWIGTLQGVNHYNGHEVINTLSYKDGFIGNRALCIFRDRKNRLWVLSDKYLHILEENKLRPIRSHPFLLDPKDAINRAVYNGNTDQLIIGLTDAVIIVDMGKITQDTNRINPALSAVMRDTSLLDMHQDRFVISPDAKKISFRFVDPARQFNFHPDIFYKLEPFDEDWKMVDNSMEGVYQKIPAGNYRLLARTANADGYYSPVLNLGKFEVLPPFWKTKGFILVSICLLLASFYFSGHFISRARYKQRLKNLQEEYRLQLERERIARELHDNVGSQLTYLINKIDDDYPSLANHQEANKLSDFARGTMQELRETIWALDKKEITPGELENKIRQLTRLYKDAQRSVEVEWYANNHQPENINSLKALNIYRIVQEALNNADKYSHASLITICARQLEKILTITVIDNGKGFERGNAKEGYGLRNMQKRAQEMNAELNILSEMNKGTTISLHIPTQ